ncbi:MAG: XRE family transcriptional regulator [Deltaproteobacteria bacterium]|nr:MAG: XRE family transcriptional regulator [Deltaproteobacteria bacterium]
MLEHTKKPRTEKLIQITITGPAANREKVIRGVKKFGYSDTSDSIPWREAFPEHDENNEAGECLAGSRYKESLTQRELAKKTGIPQRHISEMENGKRPVGKKTAERLGEILNVDYRVFL